MWKCCAGDPVQAALPDPGPLPPQRPVRPVAANVRVIASSAVNLISRVEKGEFRSDLYYALSVLSLEVLPRAAAGPISSAGPSFIWTTGRKNTSATST